MNNTDLWQWFLAGFRSAGFALDAHTFKITTGLNPAQWEVYDALGLTTSPPPPPKGTVLASRVFNWSDKMPKYAPTEYQPGNSFFDQYSAYVKTLKPQADSDKRNVDSALAQLADQKNTMKDPMTAQQYPRYTISPGLNDFYLSALQSSVSNQPAINFTIPLTASTGAPSTSHVARTLKRGAGTPVVQPVSVPKAKAAPELRRAATLVGKPNVSTSFIGGKRTTLAIKASASALRSLTARTPVQPQPGVPTTVTFTVQAVQMFMVRPGPWYNSAMVSLYSSLLDPNSVLAKQPVFGEDGFLNLKTYQILVGYKRKVTITGDLSLVGGALDPGNDFHIGGFYFGANSTATKTTSSGIAYEDNTNLLYIMGVVVNHLG